MLREYFHYKIENRVIYKIEASTWQGSMEVSGAHTAHQCWIFIKLQIWEGLS